MINYTSVFSIPIWSFKCNEWEDKKRQLNEILKEFPESRTPLQNFLTNRQSNRAGLIELVSSLFKREFTMITEHYKKDISINDMWTVSYEKNDYHSPHNHGGRGLTAILYYQLPIDSPTTTYIQPWNDWNTDRTIYRPFTVYEGDIVIVPSFLNHFSEPNKSEKTKKILSWDMMLQNE